MFEVPLNPLSRPSSSQLDVPFLRASSSDCLEEQLISALPDDAYHPLVLQRRGTSIIVFQSNLARSEAELLELYSRLEKLAPESLKLVVQIRSEGSLSELATVEDGSVEHIKLSQNQAHKNAAREPQQASLEAEIERTKPAGAGVWRISYRKTPSGADSLQFAVVRMQLPDGQVKAAHEWLSGLSAEYGLPLILQPRRARNGITRQLQDIAGKDQLVTDPGRVSAIIERLHGNTIPDLQACEMPLPYVANAVDIRRAFTITIDPPGAIDLDDALSIEFGNKSGNRRLYVSFADVSWLVRPGDLADEHARSACFSHYGLQRASLLFGSNFIRQLSLAQGEDRLGFTVMFEFTPSGQFVSSGFFRSLLRVDLRLSAEEADLASSRKHTGLAQLLGEIDWACQAARSTSQPQTRFIDARGAGRAGRMVEQAMIAAKEHIARFFERHGAPVIYKVHTEPRPELVQGLLDDMARSGIEASAEDLKDSARFARFMSCLYEQGHSAQFYRLLDLFQTRSHYSLRNAGHSGLGLGAYVEIKGLRNYAGLINQRQAAHLLSGEPAVPLHELRTIERQLNRKKHTMDDVTFRLITLEKIASKLEKAGMLFEGRLIKKNGEGTWVSVPGLTGRGLLLGNAPDITSGGDEGFPVKFLGYRPGSKEYVFSTLL